MKNFTKRNEQHLPKERFRFLNQGNSDGVARIDSQEMINHALEGRISLRGRGKNFKQNLVRGCINSIGRRVVGIEIQPFN